MSELNLIARQLNDGLNIADVRHSIITLMLDQLHALQAAPKYWEGRHFANAVAALGMNIHAIQQPTPIWLRLCLVDLRKAIEFTPPNAPYTEHDSNLDEVTILELIATIEALNEQA